MVRSFSLSWYRAVKSIHTIFASLVTTCRIRSKTTAYVYDALGQLAAEYTNEAGSNQPECETCYLTTDRLGSTRLVTDENGAVSGRHDYYPFGWEILAGVNGCTTEMGYTGDWSNPKFTGQLRDHESGLNLDYFGARYPPSLMGKAPANA